MSKIVRYYDRPFLQALSEPGKRGVFIRKCRSCKALKMTAIIRVNKPDVTHSNALVCIQCGSDQYQVVKSLTPKDAAYFRDVEGKRIDLYTQQIGYQAIKHRIECQDCLNRWSVYELNFFGRVNPPPTHCASCGEDKMRKLSPVHSPKEYRWALNRARDMNLQALKRKEKEDLPTELSFYFHSGIPVGEDEGSGS